MGILSSHRPPLHLSTAASDSGEGNVIGVAGTLCSPRPDKGSSKMDSRNKQPLKDAAADEETWGLSRLRQWLPAQLPHL